jgi:hypothetical protein
LSLPVKLARRFKAPELSGETTMGEHKFAFKMWEDVGISVSGETGAVIGRVEYASGEDQYLIRYKSADGRAVENWWVVSALTAN